jgi:hypothetical protein
MKSSERANAVVRFVFRQTIPNIVVISRWYELQVSSVYEVRMPAFGTRAKTVECFHNNHDEPSNVPLDLRERHTFVGEGVYIRVADVSTKLP